MFAKRAATANDEEDGEFPFLQEAHSPQGQHKIDFVFVHGLNPLSRKRHPWETWTHQNGTFWPTAFLAEDMPFARIFVYGYNSSISDPEMMSAARIKNHADTLLNLLDLERGSAQGPSPSKIIFLGHSLGGLVIKQALLNAHEDPKYTSIRTATFGLVFFGCPHHGAKGVELGMVAAKVARYVSAGRASNELLVCLKHNSMFTRTVSERFRHQLEDYKVVSFVEGKPTQLGGLGPTSISHMVVEEESAVLGLSGLRETQLVLDADHKGMCKIGSRGHMYKMVKGNIKSLVDQALMTVQGYIPPPTMHPTPPPLPPRFPSNGSSWDPGTQGGDPARKVTGFMYPPTGQDRNGLAEHKNMGRWDQAKLLEQQMFQEHQRTLGPEHLTTLTTGYNLAVAHIGLGYMNDAAKWCTWVSSTSQRTLGPEHPLAMKAESLGGEILLEKGQYQEGEASCANVFARQQDNLGDDHLDTLETQRRLGIACIALGRKQDALTRLQRRSETLSRLLGEEHIQVFASALDLVETMIFSSSGYAMTRFSSEVQQASKIMPPVYQDLRSSLGPKHPLTIRALRICGTIKTLEGQSTEASDMLRRALSSAEAALGHDQPETMYIVLAIGQLYCQQNGGLEITGMAPAEARPWLQRFADGMKIRKGLNHPQVRSVFKTLGMSCMVGKDFVEAEKYFEQLSIGYKGENSQEAQEANSMLGLCQMNTMYTKPSRLSNGENITDFLSSWRS